MELYHEPVDISHHPLSLAYHAMIGLADAPAPHCSRAFSDNSMLLPPAGKASKRSWAGAIRTVLTLLLLLSLGTYIAAPDCSQSFARCSSGPSSSWACTHVVQPLHRQARDLSHSAVQASSTAYHRSAQQLGPHLARLQRESTAVAFSAWQQARQLWAAHLGPSLDQVRMRCTKTDQVKCRDGALCFRSGCVASWSYLQTYAVLVIQKNTSACTMSVQV